MNKDIRAYNALQTAAEKKICNLLMKEIDKNLSMAESKIWHGHPVWFLEGNPVVGYSNLKGNVRMIFWSGQSFDEESLQPEGSFKAAEIRYTNASEINTKDLRRWLGKAKKIQWDYKNIVKNTGRLDRIK